MSLSSKPLSRRAFTKSLSLGAMASVLSLPILTDNALGESDSGKSKKEEDPSGGLVRFGLIADVHQDLIHDASQRMERFVDAMEKEQVDFICQLGDFCRPVAENRAFLDRWNAFSGEKHHVIGNHDIEHGCTTKQAVAFYGMPARTYSFDRNGVHFISVDTNDPGEDDPKRTRYVNKKQLEWIRHDLASAKYPSIVFSHRPFDDQPFDDRNDLLNGSEVRKVFEQHNQKNKNTKVLACFAGHLHQDYVREINGIQYVEINSSSYFWLGCDLSHKSYSDEIHKKYHLLKCTVPYQESIWGIVTVDLNRGTITLQGKKTDWVGPDPWKLGATTKRCNPKIIGPRISSSIIVGKRSAKPDLGLR